MRPDDLLERLRAANPARTVRHDAVDHEHVLSRAQHERRHNTQARRRRAGWPTALVGLLLVLGGAGGALAASDVRLPLLSDDAPLREAVPSSVRVLGLRVADPAGGAPWGLRIYRTARVGDCLEIGRILEGRFDRAGVAGCSSPGPGAPPPSPDSYYGSTGEAKISVTGEAISVGDAPPDTTRADRSAARSELRTVAYGVPNGPDSAYLVVLAGDVPSHRLRAINPCERQGGRLVAAVAGRCPR